METCYKVVAQFFAMVHLGYIPESRGYGLCAAVEEFLESHHFAEWQCDAIGSAMCECLEAAGLGSNFPIEGSYAAYSANTNKYRGPWASKRRALAQHLAVYMVKSMERWDDETNRCSGF